MCTLVLGMGIGARRSSATQTSTLDRTSQVVDGTDGVSAFGSDGGARAFDDDSSSSSSGTSSGSSRSAVPDTRSAPSPG
jgi:hypothetical protein